MNKFSKKEAIKFGWDKMKVNFWRLIAVLAVSCLSVATLSILSEKISGPLGFLLNLATVAVELIIGIGLIKIMLKICDGRPVELGDLFSGYPLFWKYFIASLLVGLITFTGFILLIIPGIIWAIKYQFASYLVVDKSIDAITAIKKSGKITAGEKWNLFIFGLLLGLINVAGALALGIGLLATIPATMIATAFVYRKLLSAQEEAEVAEAETIAAAPPIAPLMTPPAQPTH